MFVIGTAGHVDHGKSTLVRALTGIDPDRLQEEKDRGMTIDLGFAWLKLPSGREVSIVDVPGHERFIKNMLAGVGGIDVALVVIAADEGVMPQTEEHLAILELLRVSRAVVALTKTDMVEAEWLELIRDDVTERIQRSTLAGSPIIAVSAVTGDGLPLLVAELDRSLDSAPSRPDLGRPRLPVDRVFTIAGFGTVATGTLVGGSLRVGQEIEAQPGGRKARVRGLQVHKQKVDSAPPGSRLAVNLAGVEVDDLHRGQVITAPGWLVATNVVDASVQAVAGGQRLAHNASVTFHSGSAEAVARVSLLDADAIAPGEFGMAQIRLEEPLALVKGDLFVLRSSSATIGGGEVIDPHPKRHRRKQTTVLESLALLQRGTPEELVIGTIAGLGLADLATLSRRTGLPTDAVQSTLRALIAGGGAFALGDHFGTPESWTRVADSISEGASAFHRQYPLRIGIPREELKSRSGFGSRLFGLVLDRLVGEGKLEIAAASVRIPDFAQTLDRWQQTKVDSLLESISTGGYAPPSLAELCAELAIDTELLGYVVDKGWIVRVSDTIAWAPDVYGTMVDQIVARLGESGTITVGEVRDMFGASRKYALSILEHLDEVRVTRRVGDARVPGPAARAPRRT